MNNEIRAERGRKAFQAYARIADENDEQTILVDLLADLRHMADSYGLDFDAANVSGDDHHSAELAEEEGL